MAAAPTAAPADWLEMHCEMVSEGVTPAAAASHDRAAEISVTGDGRGTAGLPIQTSVGGPWMRLRSRSPCPLCGGLATIWPPRLMTAPSRCHDSHLTGLT